MHVNFMSLNPPNTGYGTSERRLKMGLESIGVKVTASPAPVDGAVNFYLGVPFPPVDGVDVYWSVFELEGAPDEWKPGLDSAKLVVTLSRYSRSLLEPITTTPVEVIGDSVHLGDAMPDHDDLLPGFAFFSQSNWVPRKFFPLLLEAFEEEFRHDSDVMLYVKTWSNEINVVDAFIGKKKCVLVSGFVDDVSSLYRRFHAYALPSLEGWGLTQLEAIAMGLRPVVLGHGGVLEFCNDKNSRMVKPTGPVQVRTDARFFFYRRNMKWRLPDKEDLKRALRETREEGGFLPDREAMKARKKWSPEQAARKLVAAIEKHEVV